MLFKIDVWNPLQVTTESDISKLLQTAASDLFEKVKTADKTGNQDMVISLKVGNMYSYTTYVIKVVYATINSTIK